MATCLCEFTEGEIIFNSCNTNVLFWKRTIKLVKKISYSEISKVNLSIDRRMNSTLGIFPTYFVYLHLDILLKNNESILLECNAFEEIKELLKIFKNNKVEVIDRFNFNNLYEENIDEDVREYLHSNYDGFTENK